jgi:hypothetical protein
MVRIAFGLDGASLIGADDKSAASRAFAACCGVISALTCSGVFGHFHIRFAFDIPRSRTTPGEDGSGRCAQTSQFQKITPGKIFAHIDSFHPD